MQLFTVYVLHNISSVSSTSKLIDLTLNPPNTTKVVCCSRLLKCFKKPLWQTVWTQIGLLLGAVCFGSTLFTSIFNLSVMVGNYLQLTTSADDIFRCIFFLALQGLKLGMLLFSSDQIK